MWWDEPVVMSFNSTWLLLFNLRKRCRLFSGKHLLPALHGKIHWLFTLQEGGSSWRDLPGVSWVGFFPTALTKSVPPPYVVFQWGEERRRGVRDSSWCGRLKWDIEVKSGWLALKWWKGQAWAACLTIKLLCSVAWCVYRKYKKIKNTKSWTDAAYSHTQQLIWCTAVAHQMTSWLYLTCEGKGQSSTFLLMIFFLTAWKLMTI